MQLRENLSDYEGSDEEEEITGSDVKSVDLEIREEVEVQGGESEIKRLPKRPSNRKMRKKS